MSHTALSSLALPPLPALSSPTVHLNGTSPQDLLDHQLAVLQAFDALDAALAAATPNGRDFYPQGPAALTDALEAHHAERRLLAALKSRHETLADELAERLW